MECPPKSSKSKNGNPKPNLRKETNKWKCVWNKALSDFWCNVKFSSSFTTEHKEIWKENLVIYQKSLKAFLQATLQMLIQMLKRVIYPLI